MSGTATYTRAMASVHPDDLLLDPVPRRRPRYRWRTWTRGHVPWALVDWFPQGLKDCGQHEWHAYDEKTGVDHQMAVPTRGGGAGFSGSGVKSSPGLMNRSLSNLYCLS